MNKPIDQTRASAQADASPAEKLDMQMIAHHVWQLNADPPNRTNTYLVEDVLKVSGALVGQGQPIVIPRLSDKIDYEGELAVIIGKRGKDIAENNALSVVAGYAAANDVSARDLQFRTSQWTSGKMLDTFAPLGPALVTRDEVPDPNKLRIKTIVNGEVMQDASTADMIFHVPFIISYISQITTLEPSDVILTGTPSGVGQSRDPQVFLQAGDRVSIEIERLGVLSNPLVAEG